MSKPRVFFLSSNEQAFALFKDEFLPRLNKEIPLQSACLCTTFSDALAQLHREFDIYISDFNISSEHGENGLDFYQSIRINNSDAPFVLIDGDKKAVPDDDQKIFLSSIHNLEDLFQLLKKLLS